MGIILRWLIEHPLLPLFIVILIVTRLLVISVSRRLVRTDEKKRKLYEIRTPAGAKIRVSVGPNEDAKVKINNAIEQDKIGMRNRNGAAERG
jgi:phosphatidylglycerophosphate synthase